MTSTLSELQQSVLEAKLPSRIEVEVEENKVAGTLVLQQKAEEEAELESNKGEDEFRYGQSCCDVESISENNSTSCLTQRSQHHELLRTLHTSNENSSYDSLSFVSEESVVQISSGSTEMTSVDVICAEMQPENYHVSPKNNQEFCDFETIESSSSKPKRGRNRRRKMSRAAHEDWKSRVASEEQNPAAGESSEQTHGDINNIEEAVHNSADNGIRPSEAGLPSKEKQNVDRNRGSVKYSAIAQSSNKTLRELKAEQDAEDRFQADLEQAMQQSLGISSEVYEQKGLENGSPISMGNRMANLEEVGKGLQNEIGQYNCFLNVVIQSLWHLQRFREEILAISCNYHMHVGDPCVVCALREIFVGLNSPSSTMREGVIAPTTLRIALSNLYAQKDFFQEAQMNDASEVLAVMFDCLHKAFTGESVVSDRDSDTRNGVGLWDCQDHTSCIAHSLFALDVAMQMNCTRCGLESRHLKYTSFFHNINANSLRTAKILYQESSLDELLRLVDMNQFLACDVEVGGCGQQNYIHHLLRLAPHVFIIVLGWQNSRESLEDISATMDTITLEIDAGVIYCGLDKGFKHQLVSVICYYGQHYHCFAFNHELRKWIMFDDSTVKIAGTYEDVVDTCRRGHLQPQVLFYEALSRHG
ncbi:hypothetical protein KP509_1Z176700 [Ceratopteris richardii]|nr:hypothetical protein KP509_1Z176700 [Ceratopteris richardii]